jgi:hypothetical protein
MYWLDLVAASGACAKLILGISKREKQNQIVRIDIIKGWRSSKGIEENWTLAAVFFPMPA